VTASTSAQASDVRVDPSPFDLAGRGRAAALCLHGLTGTPYEVRPLGEAFARRGIRAFGPALPGHNETPERLARTSHTAWIEAARAHLHELRAGSDRVFVAGMSMGGLLALDLAAAERVDGLVTIGTPLRLHHPLARLIPLVKHLRSMLPKPQGSDICDDAARERHPSYDVMPLHALHELQRLQRRVRRRLDRVTAPILVAHGARDRTAHLEDARTIHAGVASPIRELMFFESSGHVVPVDTDGPRLAEAAAEFLGRQADQGPG
jgi:carboxylesterase